MWSLKSQRSPRIPRHNVTQRRQRTLARTHVDDDVERVVVGQKDANTAAVLHGFVVVEVQSVHLRVAGTGQAPPPATWARGPPMSRLLGRRQHQWFFFFCVPPQLHPRRETVGPAGSAGRAAATGEDMGTRAAVSHCGDTEGGRQHHSSSKIQY